jgi:two-component system sensor histidine kinase FlrB
MQQLLNDVKAASEAMVEQQQSRLALILPEPDIEIIANKVALSSAISNLIHNSLQANPAGGQITLSAARAKDYENHVVISVRDEGIGLDEAHLDKLFEPFFTTKSHGTGLGLAVVNSVANSHQGFVKAANHPSGGAEFCIYLPILNASN